jgi:hypothetical protein
MALLDAQRKVRLALLQDDKRFDAISDRQLEAAAMSGDQIAEAHLRSRQRAQRRRRLRDQDFEHLPEIGSVAVPEPEPQPVLTDDIRPLSPRRCGARTLVQADEVVAESPRRRSSGASTAAASSGSVPRRRSSGSSSVQTIASSMELPSPVLSGGGLQTIPEGCKADLQSGFG